MTGPVPAAVAARSWSLDWLSTHAGAVYWTESSPAVGRDALMRWTRDGGVTSVGSGVGNSLHAYGGRPYTVGDAGVIATLDRDGQVWNLVTGARLTDSPHQHGDLDAAGTRVCCVRETDDGDELVVIDSSGESEVVHRGPFLAAPRLHGDLMVWTEWTSDAMPWDAAEIRVGRYRPGLRIDATRHVAGGPGEAAHQPSWGSDGSLYLLSDRTGWWNLYRWHPASPDAIDAVAPMAAECGAALWESGYASYTVLPDGRIAVIAQNGPRHRVLLVNPDGTVTELRTPFTSIKPFLAPTAQSVALIGAAPDRAPQVAVLDTDGSGSTQIVRGQEEWSRYPISTPEELVVDSSGGPITVVFHPADAHTGPSPLIVRPHPGPTHNSELRFDAQVQYFTSRGFAVADVDYRGSTGYGRPFRTALNGRWGELDVADCAAAANHLVHAGRARADEVFISGASAGGYTALRAVSRPDTPFALAVARSAIVSPNRWTVTAPRFQRAHAATLAHAAADVDPATICRPVVLIHGHDDPIAPAHDVTDLAGALACRGLLVTYLNLPGTGHYLSDPSTVTAALECELAAYRRHLSAPATG